MVRLIDNRPLGKPKRVIFAVHGGRAVLAKEGTTLNHVAYMIQQGIMKSATDPKYDEVVRGYVQHGEMYAFQGVRLTLPERTNELLSRLRQISHKLGLDKSKPLKIGTYGVQQDPHGLAPHQLSYVTWKLWTDEEVKTGIPALHGRKEG